LEAIEEGRADLAITFSSLSVDAAEGRQPYKAKSADTCQIASLVPHAFHLVVRADAEIQGVSDLKGRSAAFRPRGTSAEQVTRALLNELGLSYADFGRVFFGTRADGVAVMKDGETDLFTLAAPVPAPDLKEIAMVRDVALLSVPDAVISRLQAKNRGFRKIYIPAGSYPKLNADVQTFGYSVHLVGRCSLADPIVHSITEALVRDSGILAKVARESEALKPSDLEADVGIAFHPAATRFYRERSAP
jgi:hypothetical protein